MTNNSFLKYREQADRTRSQEPGNDPLINATLGLCGESGEFCDLVKKMTFHVKSIPQDMFLYELGDVLFYLDWCAKALGFTLQQVADANISKLMLRYPDGFVQGGGIRKENEEKSLPLCCKCGNKTDGSVDHSPLCIDCYIKSADVGDTK